MSSAISTQRPLKFRALHSRSFPQSPYCLTHRMRRVVRVEPNSNGEDVIVSTRRQVACTMDLPKGWKRPACICTCQPLRPRVSMGQAVAKDRADGATMAGPFGCGFGRSAPHAAHLRPTSGCLCAHTHSATPAATMGTHSHWPMLIPSDKRPKKASGSRKYSAMKRKLP